MDCIRYNAQFVSSSLHLNKTNTNTKRMFGVNHPQRPRLSQSTHPLQFDIVTLNKFLHRNFD